MNLIKQKQGRITKKLFQIVSCMLFLIPSCMFAQTGRVTVKGQVTFNGEPLSGVTVLVQGANMYAMTDDGGNYTITAVDQNSVLVFSFIGYKTVNETVGTRSIINVTMEEDVQELEQTVVVGYGTQRKSDVTGAIASVSEGTLREVPVSNISQAMQGRIAGVMIQQTGTSPGKGSQIRIRGNRSLSADDDPLIIVDGIPFHGTLNDLAPDAIKSIDILKDASSTAIYGSRGANGVILITTFRSVGQTKPQITYNAYYGIGSVAKKYEVFNAAEFVKYREISGYQSSDPWLPQEMQYFETGRSYDWQDELYQSSMVTNHDLNFRAGSDVISGNLGITYYNETSPIPGQEFTRYALRGNLDMKMTKWLKVGLSTQNSFGFRDGEGVDIIALKGLVNFSPMVNPYDEDGNIIAKPLAPREDGYNPLLIKNEKLWTQERQTFMSHNAIYAEVQILPELKYRANLGFFYLHNQYGTYYASGTPFRDGSLSTASLSNTNVHGYTLENLLYYDKTFAGKHKIGATLLYSVEDYYAESSQFTGTDMTADYIQYRNLATANSGVTASGSSTRRVLLSYMGRLNYSFDNKYMATVTFRSDGSSVLAAGNKWHSYPAISLAWNIHRENFMEKFKFLDMLKFRIGYGQTSNQAVSPYATLGSMSQSRYNFGEDYVYGYAPFTIENNELGWEYSDTYNAGLDFSFFKGRLSGTLDVYLQKTTDVIVGQNMPASSGVQGTTMLNLGKTQNKGMEFSLSGAIFRPSNPEGFNWDVDYNISFNRNKLLSLNSGVTQNEAYGWFVGYPINVFYDYKKIGIWQLDEADEAAQYGCRPGQLKLEDYNKDGVISVADRYVTHTFEPDALMGMTHRLRYRNFDFTLVAYAQIGGSLVSTLHQRNSYLNTLAGRLNNLRVDYWTETNPTNAYPKPDYTRLNNSFDTTMGLFDASFVKIQTITLGYTLPKSLLSKFGITDIRVYLTCNNVATLFSPYMDEGGVDPQPTGYGSQGTVSSNTVQNRQLAVGLSTPPVRQFLLGASIKF
ncbi:MAG: TonB-dependent receptor [Dysgonamonadaceae bacterium]|jgi:TonB-linked SusC/RagA family outer membrane protein|nr:TonB-dependent receptor [Dysgonamonadaceae bacterium]